MFSRPPVTSFGCAGCRKLMLRAIVARPSPVFRTIHQTSPYMFRQPAHRLFSSERNYENGPSSTQPPQTSDNPQRSENMVTVGEPSRTSEQPWFLEVEAPTHPPSLHSPTLPEAPSEAPALIQPMIKYIFEDMGLDDISLMDLRDLDPPAALGPNLIMLFATARSERHLHVSSGRFVRWLRRNHKVDARADGLIGPGELKTKLRRLRKKAKLMGTNTMILPGGDNGISTGWVCVNFHIGDAMTDETASFDETGRFSGFGAAPTGTTIVIQCMTEPRRNELDLETLWQGILKRNLEQTMKIKGQAIEDKKELDLLVSSKLQLPKSESALQWQKMQQASQQQRYYSTSVRQPRVDRAEPSAEEDGTFSETNELGLTMLHDHITNLQTSGTPISPEILERLTHAVFQAPSSVDDSVARLQLADQLFLAAEERGMAIQSKDVLVTLIEAIVASPAYGDELARAQKNLEYLLLEQKTPLNHDQTLRLMRVYAERQAWDRFWDTFRSPTRFRISRSAEMYELVYRVMVSTKDSKMCIDALRWVYPEMLKEEHPIYPTGPVYNALKACILTADPAAEELLHNPPPLDSLDTVGQRRLQRREFVRVLKEVENLNRQLVGNQAREERAQAMNRFYDADATN